MEPIVCVADAPDDTSTAPASPLTVNFKSAVTCMPVYCLR